MNVHAVKYKRLETGLMALVLFTVAFFVIIMSVFPEAFQNFRGRGSFWLHLLLTPIGRWIVLPVCAILSLYTGLAALLRAVGRHKAIEIKASGLSVSSLWSESEISWKEFERVQIESFQGSRSSKAQHNLLFHWIDTRSSGRKKIRVPLQLTDLPAEAIGLLVEAIDDVKSGSIIGRLDQNSQTIAVANPLRPKFGRKAI